METHYLLVKEKSSIRGGRKQVTGKRGGGDSWDYIHIHRVMGVRRVGGLLTKTKNT